MHTPSFGRKPLDLNRTAENRRQRRPQIPALVLLEICLAIAGCAGGTSSTPSPKSIPSIYGISPTSRLAGAPTFTLTVGGGPVLPSSTINFGGTAIATTFVSSSQLTATIPAAAIASAGNAAVTVTTGGVTSNTANFTIYAQSPQFTPTGSMTTARTSDTATLLPNGKVLIAGGVGASLQPLASAELYDPATRTFAPTGSMTTARTGHTATLLGNGKVLIAGGSDNGNTLQPFASAELYDPSTGIFTPTGSMTTAQHTDLATLLADGRVLIAKDDNAELYDPAAGTFALTGAYVGPTLIAWSTATLLLDSRVLLAACLLDCFDGTGEVFDPKSGTFSLTAPIPGWDGTGTATLLMNGKVLFVGYAGNFGTPDHAQVYDPAAGSFLPTGDANAAHLHAPAVRLADGTVLVAGGQFYTGLGGNGDVTCDLYLPATGTFVSAGNMTLGRYAHTATLLNDGTVLIAGGFNIWPTPTSSAEIYKP